MGVINLLVGMITPIINSTVMDQYDRIAAFVARHHIRILSGEFHPNNTDEDRFQVMLRTHMSYSQLHDYVNTSTVGTPELS